MQLTNSFWQDRRVLLTGHTGFKGAWLAIWLSQLGAKTCGFALDPDAGSNLFDAAKVADLCEHRVGDMRKPEQIQQVVREFKPEVVLHLAAQSLVRKSYSMPTLTFDTNVMGTVHLLDALRDCHATRAIVAITTDKVYRNQEDGRAFIEDDHLGGHDPYSASKAASEIAIESYRRSFFAQKSVGLTSVRAGNVIGGGDWSADRILPDAVNAWQKGLPLVVRNPHAVRPWQHVVEPLHAYLLIAEAMCRQPDLAGAYNIGPSQQSMVSVGELVRIAAIHFDKTEIQYDEKADQPHEAQVLRLDSKKAHQTLGILPVWNASTAVQKTMIWHQKYKADSEIARQACQDDIDAFCSEVGYS
jgi:CDP-glucose 4,6-dehydratase